MKTKIIKNKAICFNCDMEIESKDRHDFVRCNCGNIAVDGGLDYIKRSFMPDCKWKDTSIVEEVEDDG